MPNTQELENKIKSLEDRLSGFERSLTGNGVIHNYGKRLGVDMSINLTEIVQKIDNIPIADNTYWNRDEEHEIVFPKTLTDKVGVNTNLPEAQLAVNGGVNIGGDEDPGDNNLTVAGNVGIGTNSPVSRLQVAGDITQTTNKSILRSVLNTGRKQIFAGNNGYGQSTVAINNWTPPSMVSIPHEEGADAFAGVLFIGDYLWFVPYTSSNLIKVSPATNKIVARYAHGESGTRAFIDAVSDGVSFWMVPFFSDDIVKVDPSDGTMTKYPHLSVSGLGAREGAFAGGAFANDYVWMSPSNSPNLLRLDPSDGSITGYAHNCGTEAFYGIVYDGKSLWLVPGRSKYILKVDPLNPEPANHVKIQHGKITNGFSLAFAGGNFDGVFVWMAALESPDIIRINPDTNEVFDVPHGYGEEVTSFAGIAFDGESQWLCPYGFGATKDILKINPLDNSISQYTHGKGLSAFVGITFEGERIWLSPHDSDDIVAFRPQEFGREGIHTQGVLQIGGDAFLGGDLYIEEGKKIYFDSTDTYITANTDDPEDLEIHADQDIALMPDHYVGVNNLTPQYTLDVSGDIHIPEEARMIFDSDDTYITANSDDPEDLEVHADADLHLQPDNATTIGDGAATNYLSVNNTGDLSFHGTARIAWTKIAANGVTLGDGPPTSSDTVSDLRTAFDGNTYTVDEDSASAGQNLIVDFTGVTAFNWVRVLGYYDGQSSHELLIQIEVSPFDDSTWHTFQCMNPDHDYSSDYSFFVPDDSPYINSGVVKVRFWHPDSGNSNDDWVFEEVSLYQ